MQISGKLKKLWAILKQSGSDFVDDKVLKLSAALAYYTIFSVAPMLIIIIFLCDLFLGKDAIEGNVYGQIQGLVGQEAALQIQAMIKINNPGEGCKESRTATLKCRARKTPL